MYQKLFLILTLTIISRSLFACSCGSMTMSVAKINNYELVFKGKIISKEVVASETIMKEDSTHAFSLDYFKYTFEVTEEIKPQLNSNEIVVYSITQGSACGVDYMVNDEYYIFSYVHHGNNFTGLCAANKKVKQAKREFKKVVCQYKKPKDREIWKNVNGEVVSKGKIISNLAEGEWINYHKDGTIKSKGHYVNAKKEGEWHYFENTIGSEELHDRLSESQRKQLKNPKNICNRKEWFEKGERIDIKHIFNGVE